MESIPYQLMVKHGILKPVGLSVEHHMHPTFEKSIIELECSITRIDLNALVIIFNAEKRNVS